MHFENESYGSHLSKKQASNLFTFNEAKYLS